MGVIVCLVALMPACSTLPRDFVTPKFSISDLTPKDMTLLEQRFDVQLRVQNPNNFDLGLTGIRFEIDLNEQKFGNGMSGASVTVPRLSSEVITGEVITGVGSFLRQAQSMSASAVKLRYRLKGTAFADSPGDFTIPFDESGEVDLNFGSATQE
ncbi:MAG: LEA type 2 family protein [Nitrospirales bacterium]|nr:LEA type 2 family protein [Nitrospirales bacterium]